jgi:hypothetical protein
MAASDYYDTVQKFYIAFYQRPADPAGLIYWAEWFNENSGNFLPVLEAFANSAEAQSLFGDITSDNIGTVINGLYQAAFNRDAEQGGIDYWSGEFTAGRATAISIVYAVLAGAQNDDLTTVNNKLSAANLFTTAIDPELDGQDYQQTYAGDSAVTAGRSFLSVVTSDSSTVPSSSDVSTYFDTYLPGGGDSGDTGDTSGDAILTQAQEFTYTSASVGTLLSASDSNLQAVLAEDGSMWYTTDLTFNFNSSIPAEYDSEDSNGWSAMNSDERAVVYTTIAKLEALTGLSFTEVSSDGDVRLNANDQSGSSGYAYYPGDGVGGDVFVNTEFRYEANYYEQNFYGYSTIIHELGHAMGLKHTFEGDYTLSSSEESTAYSIMSYTDSPHYIPTFTFDSGGVYVEYDQESAYADEYMLYDVAALQALYGANLTTNTGDTTYTIDPSAKDYTVIWDAGGVDTIDASGSSGYCDIDLTPGTVNSANVITAEEQKAATLAYYAANGIEWADEFVDSAYAQLGSDLYEGLKNLTITYGTIIENVYTGSGNDAVFDNLVDNVISTGAGDDSIYIGSGGFDIIYCGDGDDTVYISGDVVSQQELSDGSTVIIGENFAAQIFDSEYIYA